MTEQDDTDDGPAETVSEMNTVLPRQEGINIKKAMRIIQYLLDNDLVLGYKEGNAKLFAYLCDCIGSYHQDISKSSQNKHAKKELFQRLCDTVIGVNLAINT